MGYTKLWSDITDSSVWSAREEGEAARQRQKDIKILWVTLLAKSDGAGLVRASIGGLARAADLTREETEIALANLMAPDPDSKSQVAEGRRVLRVDGGYALINHSIYRDRKDDEADRERRREYMRSYRANAATSDTSESVTPCNPLLQEVSQAEAEAKADQKQIQISDPPLPPKGSAGARKTKKQGDLDLSTAQARRVLEALSDARRRVQPRSRSISPTPSNLKLINDRLSEGFTYDDAIAVIKVCELECRRDMSAFGWFDAITPFRPENFSRKLARADVQIPTRAPNGPSLPFNQRDRVGPVIPDAAEVEREELEENERLSRQSTPEREAAARRSMRETIRQLDEKPPREVSR